MEQLRQLFAGATAGPEYPPDEGDRRDVSLFGLQIPLRASVAIAATTALIVVDQTGWLSPDRLELFAQLGPVDATSAARFFLFLLVPLAIVILGFRDDPRR